MQTPQVALTKCNESVLEGHFPQILNQNTSVEIYKTFVGANLPDDKLFVVLGTDSGLLLDYLVSIATPGECFICIDYPEVIKHIEQTRASLLQSNQAVKIELHTFDRFEYEYLYINHQDYVIRNAIILLRSLMTENNEARYKGIYEIHKELFHQFQIDRADNHDFKKVFDQQLESVCDLMYPLSVIKDRLKGDVPGILLGGGPSLDQAIPWLKKHQHKVWIFAASRICKRLLKEGITPDFIGVFDGQPLIFDYSKEMYEFQKRTVLITGEHPYRPLIRQWSGLKLYSRRRFPWARGSEDNFISDGPTVTNALFGIAAYLGVQNFYLAGVDFCFTLEGVCHESGSIESKNQQRDAVDTKAINYRGEEVGTNIQLYDARNLFEEQFLRLRKTWPTLQAHNLNDGAAVMQGIDYQPFETVVLSSDKFKIVEDFNQELSFDSVSEKAFQNFLSGEVNSHSKWLAKIVKESKKGLHLTSVLFSVESKQSARIKEILKLKEKLERLVGVDYQTLVNYGYQTFMTTLKPVASESNMSQLEMENALMGFFGGLSVAAKEFLQKLEEIKEDIAFRLLEIDQKTDFETLAEHWLKSGVPGRYYVWLEHYSEQTHNDYTKHFPELVTQLENAFQVMKTDESALEQHFSQRLNTPDEFVLRLQKAFEDKSLQAVQDISRQLKFIDSAEYRMVKSYATGLLLELKGSLNDALIHYSTVDPKRQFFIIQQQIFPLAFSLQQYEKGVEALKSLSQNDVRYVPKYAEALSIVGDFERALEVYRSYPLLNQDTDALINLIRLLVQKGAIEEANVLLEQAEGNALIDQVQLESFVQSLNEGE